MKEVQALYQWYMNNKRDLPWRINQDPYRVMVSEIMLQQTRVEAVIAKYNAFLDLFPDVKSLALASEQDVLLAWQGLGYYRRARNLKKTCETIYFEYSNQFPQSYVNLLKLPGIGDYSASAISSIAFSEKRPVLDGNVIRILSRIFALAGDPKVVAIKKNFQKCLAEQFFYDQDPGNYNQALMELGALICTPKQVKCELCPVSTACLAKERDQIELYPELVKKEKKVKVFLYFYMDLIEDQIHIADQNWKNYQEGYISPPYFESNVAMSDLEIQQNLKLDDQSLMVQFKHSITKYNIDCRVYAKSNHVIEKYAQNNLAKTGFLLKALKKFKVI
ncbi:A/G-specific adenine glycosylase [bacterium]|nr:A/G-specific adenine glycosylase [bacterium]